MPLLPWRAKRYLEGAMGKRDWPEVMVVSRWPLRIDSGRSLSYQSRILRLVIVKVHLRRPAHHVQIDHLLGLGREVRSAHARPAGWPAPFVPAPRATPAPPCRGHCRRGGRTGGVSRSECNPGWVHDCLLARVCSPQACAGIRVRACATSWATSPMSGGPGLHDVHLFNTSSNSAIDWPASCTPPTSATSRAASALDSPTAISLRASSGCSL